MKALYLECNMGAAGDMLMSALSELIPDKEDFVRRLNALNIPKVTVSAETAQRCGINGTHLSVKVDGMEEISEDVHSHVHLSVDETLNVDNRTREHLSVDNGKHRQEGSDKAHLSVEGAPRKQSRGDESRAGFSRTNSQKSVALRGTHKPEHPRGRNIPSKKRGIYGLFAYDSTPSKRSAPEKLTNHGALPQKPHKLPVEEPHSPEPTAEHSHEAAHTHEHSHGHFHSSLHDIEGIITKLDISEKVKSDALAVYRLIAEAESHAHGKPVEEIHFHEVGTMDAVADIVGVCMLMEEIRPDKVICSPVHVGCGQVRCAHGILPVPAPATAHILQGVPIYGGRIQGELCTPTGAALLKHFVSEFGEMPVMSVSKLGIGMGTKEFPQANCIRAMLGEIEGEREDVCEICCNLDDMTPEALAFAEERLLEGGALDVYTVPVGMKKSRSAVMLVCLCAPEKREDIIRLIFRHTSTIGIRERSCRRVTLKRTIQTVNTKFGVVRVKVSEGFGVKREKPEYDDLAQIAREHSLTLEDAQKLI